MSGPPKIFVDFNNRADLFGVGEFYRVSLRELEGLPVGTHIVATDYEDLELPARVFAVLHEEREAIIRVEPVGPTIVSSDQGDSDRQIEKALRAGTSLISA